jgi:hypothetical protein
VYGRTGAVVARQGDYNTDLVTEGQALYFTNDRARKSISVTTFNTSGPATYDSTTGILNIPQYGSGLQGSYVPTSRTITINGQTADLSANRIFSIDSMVYPSAGIPLSNGTSWGTSIVNNSANWNTAFGWGNHAGLYSLLGHTHTFASLTSKPTTLSGYGITDAATSAQGANADTAYGWGDHSIEGYLTSFTETDPTVASHIKAITTTNIANWNSAYSWGNHALTGYLTSFTETDPIWTSEKINYYTKLQADARYLQSYTETDPVWTSEKANYALKTYVDTSISNLVDSAPGTLNTLNELAAALGDDANFSTTITTLIGTKESVITAGTTAQYWRGDKTWQTLPVYTLGGLGGVPTARTLTINGTSYDLSADRSWSINSMVYPSAGIAVSTGSAWGTSITDNSSNWNTAYSWGNHASAGYLTASTAASTYLTISNASSTYLSQSSANTIYLNKTDAASTYLSQSSAASIYLSISNASSTYLSQSSAALTYVSLSGSYSNPSWVTSLPWSKITGAPAFITSYTETDTLASVTGRGSTTSTSIQVNEKIGTTDNKGIFLRGTGDSTHKLYYSTTRPGIILEINNTFSIDFYNAGSPSTPFTFSTGGNFYAAGTISASNFSGSHSGASSGTNTGDQTLSGLGGVPTSRTITINGTAYDLSADRSWSIAAGVTSFNTRTGAITLSSGDVTGALGYTPYNSTNPSGYITGNQNITLSGDVTGSGATSIVTTIANNAVTTAKINNGAVTAAKLATFGAGEGIYWAANTDGASIIFESTGDGASGGRALSNLLIALTDNGDEGLKVTTTGAELLYVNTNQFQYKGNNVWHAGNLTNLNQLANGPGYITGISSTTVINALGYTPYNSSNPIGYITSSASISGASARLSSRDNRTISPSEDNAAELRFGFTSWANNDGAPYADYLHLRSYSDSSGGSDNLVMFLKSGIGMRIWQQSFGSGTAYSSYVDVYHTGNLTNLNQLTNGPGYVTSSALSSYLPLSGGSISGTLTTNGQLAVTNNIVMYGDNKQIQWNAAASADLFISAIPGTRTIEIRNGNAASPNYAACGLITGYATFTSNVTVQGNITVSSSNATGGGIILADDGDIVDLNDAYCSMRFSYGVRIYSANRGGSPVITLSNTGVVTATTFSGALSGNATTASSISGFNNPTTAANANTIVYRDGSGDVAAREFVLTASTIHVDTPSSMLGIYPTTNQVVKFGSPAARNFLNVPTRTGGDASGTWGISISGSAAQLGGWSLQNVVPYHSGSDFPNGTLVVTSINAAVTYGDSFVMEVTGKSYGSGAGPFALLLEGYIYYDTFINVTALSYGGYFPGPVRILNYGGNLAFWWPRGSYWNSFSVKVREAGGSASNRVTSISDSTEPSSSKKVSITPVQSLHSSNFSSYALPLTGGTMSGAINMNGYSITNANAINGTHGIFTNDGSSRVLYLRGSGNIIQFQDGSATNKWEVVGRDGTFYVYKADGGGSGMRWQIDTNGNHSISGAATFNSGATFACGIGTGRGSYAPGTLNIVLTSSSGGSDGVCGIDFRSGNNYPSDGASIYYENSQTGSGEVSRLVFRVENDLNDSILMRAGYHVYNARTVDMASQGADNPVFRWQYLDSNRMTLDSSGNLVCNGDITAYSDTRVKTDVKVIENSIEKIQAIRGVTFLRTDAQEQDKEKRHAGVIAQEVLEVLPEVVTENAEGMYSVAYGNLVALLIEGMKEQQTQIEELKNEIKELKNK